MQNSDDPQNNFLQSHVTLSEGNLSQEYKAHSEDTAVETADTSSENQRTPLDIRLPKNDRGSLDTVIGVIGVGGAGCNAINNLKDLYYESAIHFIACNTDKKALKFCKADHVFCLDEEKLNGLGSGSDPRVGLRAATHSINSIMEAIAPLDMVFVLAGMGKGTGTGAAGLIAKAAREMGKLVIAVVSKPFYDHGSYAMNFARQGIFALSQYTHGIVVFDNQHLQTIADPQASLLGMFKQGDLSIAYTAISTVCDIAFAKGAVGLDFSDIKTVLMTDGYVTIVSGNAKGAEKSRRVLEQITQPPLLDKDIRLDSAKAVLLSIVVSPDLPYTEYATISTQIRTKLNISSDSNLFLVGVREDSKLEDEMKVSVIFAGVKIDNLDLNNGINDFVQELRDFDIPSLVTKNNEATDLFQIVHDEEPLLSDSRIEANVEETNKLKKAGLWPNEQKNSDFEDYAEPHQHAEPHQEAEASSIPQNAEDIHAPSLPGDEKHPQEEAKPATIVRPFPTKDIEAEAHPESQKQASQKQNNQEEQPEELPKIVKLGLSDVAGQGIMSNANAQEPLSAQEGTTAPQRAVGMGLGMQEQPPMTNAASMSLDSGNGSEQDHAYAHSLSEEQHAYQERQNIEMAREHQPRQQEQYTLPSSLQHPQQSVHAPYAEENSAGLFGQVIKKVSDLVMPSEPNMPKPHRMNTENRYEPQAGKGLPERHHTASNAHAANEPPNLYAGFASTCVAIKHDAKLDESSSL